MEFAQPVLDSLAFLSIPEDVYRGDTFVLDVKAFDQVGREYTPADTMEVSLTHSGTEAVLSGSAEDDWLITPGITVTENSELRFYRLSSFYSAYQYNGVHVSTVDQEPDNFSELEELGQAPDSGWQKFVIDLSGYAGQTIYLAFVYQYNTSAGDGFYIDDVEITQ